MRLLSAEAGDALVTSVVSRLLVQAEAAGLTVTDLAQLLGVPRLTIYRWRKIPESRAHCYGGVFLNCLIVTKSLQRGLLAGELPAPSRARRKAWIKRMLWSAP